MQLVEVQNDSKGVITRTVPRYKTVEKKGKKVSVVSGKDVYTAQPGKTGKFPDYIARRLVDRGFMSYPSKGSSGSQLNLSSGSSDSESGSNK